MKVAKQTDNKIAEFVELVSRGIQCWVDAGKIVAEAVDEDPEWIDRVCDQIPGLSRDTVSKFEAIGRGLIEPKLLLSESPGSKRLLRMPISDQRRYIESPVPLLINNGGTWETLLCPVENLTPAQARQVFGEGHVRTEGQQRAWIADQSAKVPQPSQYNEPYRVAGAKLVVMEPCQFTRKQLAQLLAQME